MRFIFSRKLTRGSFPCTGQYRHSFVRSVAPGRTDRVSLARRERWMIKSEVRENSLRPALTPPRYWSDAAAWPSGENVDRERHMQSVACFVLTGAGCLSNRVGWLEPARLYRYLDQIRFLPKTAQKWRRQWETQAFVLFWLLRFGIISYSVSLFIYRVLNAPQYPSNSDIVSVPSDMQLSDSLLFVGLIGLGLSAHDSIVVKRNNCNLVATFSLVTMPFSSDCDQQTAKSPVDLRDPNWWSQNCQTAYWARCGNWQITTRTVTWTMRSSPWQCTWSRSNSMATTCRANCQSI